MTATFWHFSGCALVKIFIDKQPEASKLEHLYINGELFIDSLNHTGPLGSCSTGESEDKGPIGKMLWLGSRSSQEPYEYRALRTTSTIRLIKVCRNRVNGCIACRIYHFDKKQLGNVKYHALSYVWGDPTPTRQVYLRDQETDWHPFPLHENLWQFLDHAWRHKRFGRLFWTDRLCLDQNSHEEISQQVPRMRAIYRNAELVEIWLKLGKEEQKGLSKLVRLRHGLKLMPEGWQQTMRHRLSLSADDIYAQALGNHYWRRIWIVQEVVVAKKVCITFEDVSIDLDELPALLNTFRTDHTRGPAHPPAFSALVNMRAEGGKLPLWRILRDFAKYESSRPSDRVYGLLGMVADHHDGSSPLENIQVDYDKPTLHVMLDALLESSPPLKTYNDARLILGPRDTCDNLALLESYIMSSKTTPRHRDFADFTLQTLEAFDIIKSIPGRLEQWKTNQIIGKLLLTVAMSKFNPTLAQSAVLAGILIARNTKAHLHAVKAHRRRRGEESSPWRCTFHRAHNTCAETVRLNEEVVGTVFAPWEREEIVNACAEQSQSCDGSTMTFEIAQAGLRLLVTTTAGDLGEGRLRLNCVKGGSMNRCCGVEGITWWRRISSYQLSDRRFLAQAHLNGLTFQAPLLDLD